MELPQLALKGVEGAGGGVGGVQQSRRAMGHEWTSCAYSQRRNALGQRDSLFLHEEPERKSVGLVDV